jgi:hypothetical protein
LRAVVESNGVSGLEEDAVFIPFRLKMGWMELSLAVQSPEKMGVRSPVSHPRGLFGAKCRFTGLGGEV